MCLTFFLLLLLLLQTALKMLDSNFPDEHVRKFAVNALDELADDELEDILLQLTQVGGACYHGSSVTMATA